MQTPAASAPAQPPAAAAPQGAAPPAPPTPVPATIEIPVAPPPGAAGPGNPFLVQVQSVPIPRTEAEVSALRERGSQLSRQLNSAQGRRDDIAGELRQASGADRAGLEQRLVLLDQRILALETDIAANGRLLAAAPANLIAATEQPSGDGSFGMPSPAQTTAIAIVFNLFVLAPLAFAAARRLLRRPMPVTREAAEGAQRLERMEQAVDAIAIEVERVSESQRFLTRILTEAGPMQALPVGEREAAAVRAGGTA